MLDNFKTGGNEPPFMLSLYEIYCTRPQITNSLCPPLLDVTAHGKQGGLELQIRNSQQGGPHYYTTSCEKSLSLSLSLPPNLHIVLLGQKLVRGKKDLVLLLRILTSHKHLKIMILDEKKESG